MDFGLIGMEGLVVQQQKQQQQDSGSSEQDGKRKCSGSGFVKQEGSGSTEEDDTSRASKLARNSHDLGVSRPMPPQLQEQELFAPLMRSSDSFQGRQTQSQMLSFASPRSQVKDGGGQSLTWSCYQHSPAPVYSRNAGYASGSMHGSFTGIRGPFTPAQWIELEHQALIYKYFTANVPVPATLLVPIRKAFNPSGFSGFPAGSFPAHSYGWGPFHLGYSGSTDPEPGRCRRTDGKKWRCSRDAVPDQKYCERHINRGRHRSRKPVEGQTGQAASGPTNPKAIPVSSSMSSSPLAPGGCASNSLAIPPHQLKGFQVGASNLTTGPAVNRLQDSQGPSVMPTILNMKSKDSPFSIPKQQFPYEESSQSGFGFVSNESFLNPSSKSSYLNCKNYNSFLGFNDQQQRQDQNPVRHFIDDWPPKDHSNHPTPTWPEELKSDWTQLSMSIPMSDLSPSSTYQEKNVLSSLRLSRELDQTQMGLGVGSAPISWENSMGGPLGEVLNNAGNAVGNCKGTPAPNLTGEGWDGRSQVLQKGAFASLPSSGLGSSPRDENKNAQEGACLGDDLLAVSAHAASFSIPAL